MSKRLGVCLGAGGARGAAHIGFLQALEEEGIFPDCVAGCSMGAVVGAAYAAGVRMAELKDIVFSLKLTDFISPDFRLWKSSGFFRTDKLRELLKKYLGCLTFDELKVPFRCVAADLLKGKSRVFERGFVADAVAASCAMPAIFQPVLTDQGELLADGGVVDRVPVALLEGDADIIVAVDVLATLSEIKEPPQNTVEALLRAIDVMDAGQTALLKEKRKESYHLWIEPSLGDISQYSLKSFALAYERGYESGRESRERIGRLLGEKG